MPFAAPFFAAPSTQDSAVRPTERRARRSPARRTWPRAAGAVIAVLLVLVTGASAGRPYVQPLLTGGITAAGGGVRVLPAGPRGPVPPRPPDAAQAHWLAAGAVPGTTAAQQAVATRALLDLKLLVRPDGAVAAAWYPGWKYAWPRDSSWVAAALAATGHGAEALGVLRFIARVQPRSGVWAARYQLSGDGPVRDGRPAELDADGWFPWAVWFWYTEGGSAGRPVLARTELTRTELTSLWPAVRRAADTTVSRLGRDGLPPASMDYWEDRVSSVTIGIAAPLLAGLRAAADLARILGDTGDARNWSAAAGRLGRAITAGFGATGYQRTPSAAGGADAAATFLGPPFAAAPAAVRRAVAATVRKITLANGGVEPGSVWAGDPGEAWTPETGFFALYDAASGDRAGAAHWLGWLAAHRTAFGSLPEQVNADGRPASVAPLAWTDAIALLAMTAERHRLPMP
jgi:GH15 family glucan-1,4-alpha-glucosidase